MMNTFNQNKSKNNKGSVISVTAFIIGVIMQFGKSYLPIAGFQLIMLGVFGCVVQYLRKKNIINPNSKTANNIITILFVLGILIFIGSFLFLAFWNDYFNMLKEDIHGMSTDDVAKILCLMFEISK